MQDANQLNIQLIRNGETIMSPTLNLPDEDLSKEAFEFMLNEIVKDVMEEISK